MIGDAAHDADHRAAFPRRRGLSIILVAVVLVALIGFVSLAIDVGRVRLAGAQLQTVADASARAAAFSLPVSNTEIFQNAAKAAISNPTLDNDNNDNERTNPGVELDLGEDVEFLFWDRQARTLTALQDNPDTDRDERRGANAIRTHARRTRARGNPVQLLFAPVIGVFSSDLQSDATAYITGGPDHFGFIGLDRVTATSRAEIRGSVATNGDISIGNAHIHGDARVGEGRQLIESGGRITGWTAPLDYVLNYPAAPESDSAGARRIPSSGRIQGSSDPANPMRWEGDLDRDLIIEDGRYVKIYVDSSLRLDNDFSVRWLRFSSPSASWLQIILVGNAPRTVTLDSDSTLYAHLYAPQCDVYLTGSGNFNGWIVGRTLNFSRQRTYTYDSSKNSTLVPDFKIHLVR